jgi:hypothetical protein
VCEDWEEFKEFRSSGVQEFRSSGVQEFRLGRITKLQDGKGIPARLTTGMTQRCATCS